MQKLLCRFSEKFNEKVVRGPRKKALDVGGNMDTVSLVLGLR